MLQFLRIAVISLGLFTSLGTLLSLTRWQHWSVRLWDFPRVQLATLSALSATLFRTLFFRGRLRDSLLFGSNVATVLWQGWKIFPYTPLAFVQVKRCREKQRQDRDGCRLRLMISNVLMENSHHERLIALVQEEDPDLLLVVETDDRWARALDPLKKSYPHRVFHPQSNYYGMMLFSRFPLESPEIRFLVQDDIPSVHTRVRLPCGESIVLHGLHPRPPEPIRDQDSTPRDAELVMVGKAIRKAGIQPTIVAGDLNDVAWSPTSQLFMRLSGLLDPRVGRGFYNSYHADLPFLRYPLDHVFHSHHFRLVELRRLRSIGSDHFPMLIDLSYEPEKKEEQPPTEKEIEDEEKARDRLENQAEAASRGED